MRLLKNVSTYNVMYPKTVKALLNDTYADDIQGGGDCIKDLETFKAEAEIIMKQGGVPFISGIVMSHLSNRSAMKTLMIATVNFHQLQELMEGYWEFLGIKKETP